MRILTAILFASLTSGAFAQGFAFRMGLGLGLDMGIRIDRDVPAGHSLDYQNAATPTLDVFTKVSYGNFNFTPDFKISYATFGKGRRKADNLNGSSIPEGSNLSLPHDGSFYETIERSPYLSDKSDVTLNTMSVGSFVTYSLFRSKTGYLEAGTGFFYFRKQVSFKEYLSWDIYDYYGSAGSHLTQSQTDEYTYIETKRDKRPERTQRILSHLIAVPVVIQYNFQLGHYVEISPSFTAYMGVDPIYSLSCSVSFGMKN